MKVILLQDVEKLGKKFELKEVKNGYARNFLIPNNLAKPATKEALKWLEVQKEMIEKGAEEHLKSVQDTASKIDGLEIIIPVKVGDKDQLFEKITVAKIIEKIKEAGFEVKKNQLGLAQPIEALGEFLIKIKFDDNIEAEIKVIVSAEETKSEEKEEE